MKQTGDSNGKSAWSSNDHVHSTCATGVLSWMAMLMKWQVANAATLSGVSVCFSGGLQDLCPLSICFQNDLSQCPLSFYFHGLLHSYLLLRSSLLTWSPLRRDYCKMTQVWLTSKCPFDHRRLRDTCQVKWKKYVPTNAPCLCLVGSYSIYRHISEVSRSIRS